VSREIVADGVLELASAPEGTAAQTPLCDQSEPPFDLVDPGAAGRSEMQMKSRASLCGDDRGSRLGDRIGIGKVLNLQESGTEFVGYDRLSQPPAGETILSTSLGAQVFRSYSWTGVSAFKTGSTMRHASSA
jgi:hypothetical protein